MNDIDILNEEVDYILELRDVFKKGMKIDLELLLGKVACMEYTDNQKFNNSIDLLKDRIWKEIGILKGENL